MPHTGIDPIPIASEVVLALQTTAALEAAVGKGNGQWAMGEWPHLPH